MRVSGLFGVWGLGSGVGVQELRFGVYLGGMRPRGGGDKVQKRKVRSDALKEIRNHICEPTLDSVSQIRSQIPVLRGRSSLETHF